MIVVTMELSVIQLEDLDEPERDRWSVLLADAWGLIAAGHRAPGVRSILRACHELGAGDVAVPYTGRRWSAQAAAAAASALIHGWDFDDTHDEAVVHTTAVAVPAALVAAQRRPTTGRAFADAVVVGVQVLTRLAQVVGPKHGVIRTSGLGALAAAATAATAWGLGQRGVENAMSLAVGTALAPSSRQAVADSSLAKRVQPGIAVQAGLYAAALAAHEVEGPTGWLDGEYGLAPRSGLTASDVLDGRFAGAELAIKPYPACRYGHAAIAAAQQLLDEHGSRDGDQLVAHLPQGSAYAMVARPFAHRGAPIIDAQFSVPWQLASLWVTGRYDVRTLADDDVNDPRIARFAEHLVVRQDLPASTVMSGASVELYRDGAVHVAHSPMPGGPSAPLDRNTVSDKLRTCFAVADLAPEEEIARLWDFVDAVADLDGPDLCHALTGFTPVGHSWPENSSKGHQWISP